MPAIASVARPHDAAGGAPRYPDAFYHVLSFLGPQDLTEAERVCFSWFRFICSTNLWEKQLKTQLDVSVKTLPKKYTLKSAYCRDLLQSVWSRILDKRLYEPYLGVKIGPAPPIPEEISLKNWTQPDRCNKEKIMGEAGVWMYLPSYVELPLPVGSSLYLDRPDAPNDPEAPRLIQNKWFKTKSENGNLKVPITLNNFIMLLKLAKRDNPFCHIQKEIIQQYGNRRIFGGEGKWIWMRKGVVWRNTPFGQQKSFAELSGFEIPDLLSRIWFNVFQYARSNGNYGYPDGQHLWNYARTLTMIKGRIESLPAGCGPGEKPGLKVDANSHPCGVAVAIIPKNPKP